MDKQPKPRFRAKVYAYHHGRWQWGYDVLDMRPLDRRYRPGRAIAGRAQFASQPEALAAACATLRNIAPFGVCHAADTCTLDIACPFAADCHRIEAG